MLSSKQRKILAFPMTGYDALICDGSVRSGKTSLMMWAYVQWAMDEFNGQNFIIGGKTVKSAVRNVVDPFISMTLAKRRYSLSWNAGSNELKVRRGDHENTFLVFGGKDKSSFQLVQGFTAAGCLIDEVALCERSFVEQALARCSVEGSKFWFNCNPDAPNHWFRVEWLLQCRKRNALHLHFCLDDNPSLSELIKERYRNMYSGVFKRRYIDGEWVVAEGLVYQVDTADLMCELDVSKQERCWVSIDYGITNPFVAIMWVIRNGKAYAVDEYAFDSRQEGYRKTDSELYSELDAWIGGRNVESIVIDPSASSFKEEIDRHGMYLCLDADNSVLDGIQLVSTSIANNSLLVSEHCETLIKEFGLYRWDDKSKERDKVLKESDHAMDAMRYFFTTIARDELPCLVGW